MILDEVFDVSLMIAVAISVVLQGVVLAELSGAAPTLKGQFPRLARRFTRRNVAVMLIVVTVLLVFCAVVIVLRLCGILPHRAAIV